MLKNVSQRARGSARGRFSGNILGAYANTNALSSAVFSSLHTIIVRYSHRLPLQQLGAVPVLDSLQSLTHHRLVNLHNYQPQLIQITDN